MTHPVSDTCPRVSSDETTDTDTVPLLDVSSILACLYDESTLSLHLGQNVSGSNVSLVSRLKEKAGT